MKKRDSIFTCLGLITIVIVLFGLSKSRLKRWVEAANCGNNMSSIGCGALFLAGDNSNHLADNFLVMSNELCTPKFPICSSDKIRKPAENWATFTTNNCS